MPSDKRQRQRENSRARQEAMVAMDQRTRRRRQTIYVVAGAAILLFLLWWKGPLGGSDDNSTAATATTTTTVVSRKGNPDKCPPKAGTTKRFTVFATPPTMCIDPAKKYTAAIKTDAGTITVELKADSAPNTVNNFVFLARNHYYDGVIFHRVIPDFMDQTGDPAGSGTGDSGKFPGYSFGDEIPEGYVYTDGDVAMANSGANTNGSQFFLVASDKGAETLLTAVGGVPKYTPFGHVTKGLSIVKKINKDGSAAGSPNVDHKMISVTITEE